MRKHALLALALVAVGCSTGVGPSSTTDSNANAPEDVQTTASQLRALDTLRAGTARAWSFTQHSGSRMHLVAERTGAPLLARAADAEVVTKAFLAKNKDVFKMSDPASELRMSKQETDQLGMTHARFQQHVHGVPVFGAELMAHYDAAGRITSVDSRYVPDLADLDVNPKLLAKEAVDVAVADATALSKPGADDKLEPNDGELVVFATGELPATLAYRVSTRAVFGNDPAIWVVMVDANTGEILDRYNNLQTMEGSGVGVKGDTKQFQISTATNGYSMTDTSRGITIKTSNSGGQQTTAEQGAPVFTSTSATSWDTGGTGPGAAVDAQYNAGVVADYYKAVHQRNAIDGAGSTILSSVHFGTAYDNAFWDGSSMSYGDGGQIFIPLSAAIDVSGHEFTHGVTQSTSNLTYQGQVGALNEAVSDILGCFIEHHTKPDPKLNWIMGEQITKGGATTGIRDMANPAAGQQPDNMSKYVQTQQDNGGVHINSGVVNNADYLMTMGGKNPTSEKGPQFGIGWDKSEQLWYRIDAHYLTSTSDFASAAEASMEAAKDISLTQNEQNIVDCAWKSTGVVAGDCGAIVNPQGTSAGGDGTDGTGTGDGTATGDGSGDGTGTGTGSTTTAAKKKHTNVSEDTGCNVAGGDPDFGPLAGLFAAIVGLALGRRKKQS